MYYNSFFASEFQISLIQRLRPNFPKDKHFNQCPGEELDASERDLAVLYFHLLTVFGSWDANFVDARGDMVIGTNHHSIVRFMTKQKEVYQRFKADVKDEWGLKIIRSASPSL